MFTLIADATKKTAEACANIPRSLSTTQKRDVKNGPRRHQAVLISVRSRQDAVRIGFKQWRNVRFAQALT